MAVQPSSCKLADLRAIEASIPVLNAVSERYQAVTSGRIRCLAITSDNDGIGLLFTFRAIWRRIYEYLHSPLLMFLTSCWVKRMGWQLVPLS